MDLVERETQLAALGEHLDAAVAGRGRLVLVSGEAGVGKTSLVRAFADERGGDLRFVWGACDGLFTPQPLGPLLELGDQIGLEVDGPRRDVFAATLDALRRAPTVAVVEDVHWADEATLDLIRFLGRRLERARTLIIATYRDDELGLRHPLRVLLGDVPSGRRLALPPLSERGVEALARGSEVDSAELYRLTSGNPFFVTEVLATGGSGVPESVRDAVLARAAKLGRPAREIVDAAAVVGRHAELGLLERVLDEPPGALDECLAAGVLQADGNEIAFRHELARQAVEEAIDPVRRAELHRRVLAALSEDGGSARLAHHAEAAGDAEAVLAHAPAAAEQAASLGAHREAAAQYARALRFAHGLPRRAVAELLEARAYECYLTEQVEDALAAQLEAREHYRALGDTVKEAGMLRWISRLRYLSARIDAARETARTAVELLEGLPPGEELALAYANMANLAQIDLELESALAWGDRALTVAREVGADEVVIDVSLTMGIAEIVAGRDADRVERALELALERGTADSVGRAYGGLVFGAVRRRDWSAADNWFDEGLRYTTDRDLDTRRLYLLGWRAWAFLERGRWDEAAADAETVLRHPYARLSRIWALLALGALRARRGDPDVWAPLDEATELAGGESPQKLVPLQVIRAEAAFLAGDPARALAETGEASVSDLVDRSIAGKLAVWRTRAGGELGATGPLPEPCELELAGDYAGAAAAWDRLESRYEAAMALAASDDEDELRRSHERLLVLGARPAAALVAKRLREQGARGIPRGPREATRAHPAGLTPREREVLALLEEGLRNSDIAARLVISEKTVDHHVSAILGKLGVASRAEAVRAVAALER